MSDTEQNWHLADFVASSGNRVQADIRQKTGPTLILIPETWGNAQTRNRLIEALHPDLTLVCLALAGQDENWPPPRQTSIPQFSEDILNLADHLGLRQFFVAGHSLGGMISLDLLRLGPERILGAISIEGWTHWSVLDAAFHGNNSGTLTDVQRTELERVRRLLLDRWDPDLRATYGAMWKNWDGWEILSATKIPVLEIWGDRGKSPPSRETLRIPNRPNIELAWIKNASHNLLLEAPLKLAALINNFINRTSPLN